MRQATFLAVMFLMLPLSGCFSQAQINRSLALKVSPRMSCPPDQIKISNFKEGIATFKPIISPTKNSLRPNIINS